MRSWKIGASLLVASFGLRAFFVFKFGTDLQEIWTYHFGGTSFGFFMLGHLVCLAASHLRYLRQPALGVSLTVCSFAVMTYGGSYASCDTLRFWGSVLLFTAALPGLFEATKNIRWMNLAGDLSFPIYLVHTTILLLLGAWLISKTLPLDSMEPVQAGYVSTAAFGAVTILAAFVVHKLLEAPTAWAMKIALQGRKFRSA